MDEKQRRAREAHADRMQREAQAERDKTKQQTGSDRDVEREMQTVRPHSDAPSRAGITPGGSGGDSQR
jgi:hypothetical protein